MNRITELRLAVTPSYLAAAAVCLHSFHATNPWFDGVVRLYAPSEDHALVERALVAIPRLTITDIPSTLRATVETSVPSDRGWVPERFFLLSALAEPCEGAALLLDADLLFVRDVERLQAIDGAVVACPDGPTHAGFGTHRITNAIVESAGTDSEVIPRCFNSGVIRLSGELLGPQLFGRALEHICDEVRGQLSRRQHDQFVLNRLFEGVWTEAGAEYNFLVRHARLIEQRTGIGPAAARVLHYNGGVRPWDLTGVLAADDSGLGLANSLWHQAFRQVMTATTQCSSGHDTE